MGVIDGQEISKAGVPIRRYDELQPIDPVAGEDLSHWTRPHIEKHLGKINQVFNERESSQLPIQIAYVPATSERPIQSMVTLGVSRLPMNVPPNSDHPRYLELMVNLPDTWPVRSAQFLRPEWFWPAQLLLTLGHMVHEFRTWFGPGHTIPNGDPPEPYASNSRYSGVTLTPTRYADDAFSQLKLPDGRKVLFLALLPLYREEMRLKLEEGDEALAAGLERVDGTDLFELARNNCGKRGFQGPRRPS